MKLLALLIVLTVAGIAPPGQAQGQRPAFDSDFPTPDSPIQPDLTPGYALIEGDIQVPLNLFSVWQPTRRDCADIEDGVSWRARMFQHSLNVSATLTIGSANIHRVCGRKVT